MTAPLKATSVEQALRERDFASVRRSFGDHYPADVAELIEGLEEEQRAILFRILPRDQAAEVFEYLEPEAHKELTRAVESRRKVSNRFIEEIRQKLQEALAEASIGADITGRLKSTFSIHQKMRVQKIGVDQVYDYVAFRLLTHSVKDCYGALGIVHSIWRPVPGRIKDYIAMPKPNMYQSLHTSVMTNRGQPF